MTEAGYCFDVIPPRPEAEKGVRLLLPESPSNLVARLAQQKARDVALRTEKGLVIGCDTVAQCAGVILGKPTDRDHARKMLRLLRGQEHTVLSGLSLWRRPDDRCLVQVATTQLVMEEITDDALEAYLATDGWEGKAGAFGYQDRHGWIRIVEGSETNVVGLPMELLREMLEAMEESVEK